MTPDRAAGSPLRAQFGSLAQQGHAARLGMWVFLASEALLFGGLFALYGAYRTMYPDLFREAARHTDLALGTANTVVLITSSFTAALCVRAVRGARAGTALVLVGATLALGTVFLVLKAVEYAEHFRHGLYPGLYYRSAELTAAGHKVFFTLYYFMTGLHGLHVLIGLGVLAWLGVSVRRGAVGPAYDTPLELGTMYWHLVDIVWIFLWPVFYLVR